MADRKQLMNNPGAFTVAEIAEAVRAGIVSVYELSKSGKLTPLMRRRIENELRNPAAAQQPAPVPEYTPTPAEPVAAPMPEQPAYQQPTTPAQPIMPPQPVQPVAPPQPVQPVVQPMQPAYQPPTIAPSQPVAPAYEEPTPPQPVQPIAPPQPVVPTPPPLPVATEPQQQPTYPPQPPVVSSQSYPVQPPFPEPVPQPQAPRKLPRLLSFQGRETRTNYFLISLCAGIFCFMLMFAIIAILDTYRVSGKEIAVAIVCVLITFFLYWIVWAAAVRRCHDMGKSGWFVLLSFIPVANIVVGLMLLFCGGDPGENEYGPNPR